MMLPLLTGARDKAGEITTSEAIDYVVKLMNLTEADRSQLRASGRQTVLSNRLSWARLYLAHAGLLQSTGHGRFQITERGRQFLTANPQPLDNRTLMQFPEFASWQEHVKKTAATRTKTLPDDKGSDQVAEQDPLTTEERIETAYTTLAAELRAELLERLYQVSSTQFEQVIIDLLIAMGYGGGRSEMGKAIGKSGDQGLDGVIREDALGLDVVYIQAKKHKLNSTIGRPDIQSFAGSLEGARATKGLFVTTATFSQQARDYVEKISKRIILLDGEELADLMIRHNVGVRISETYEIKKVDEEYFSE
jgi:restriction system protein